MYLFHFSLCYFVQADALRKDAAEAEILRLQCSALSEQLADAVIQAPAQTAPRTGKRNVGIA